jgi:hypothetical protein
MKKLFKMISLAAATMLAALSISSCVAEDVTKLRVRGEWQVLTVTVGEEAEDMTESGIYCKFDKGGAFSAREGESAYQNVATWGIEGTVLTLRYFDRPAETWNIEIHLGVMMLQHEVDGVKTTMMLKRTTEK